MNSGNAYARGIFEINMSALQNGKRVVIFDLDGTITFNDSFLACLKWFLRRRPWRTMRCLWLPVLVVAFKLGYVDNTYVKRQCLNAILGGCRRNQIEVWSDQFVQHLVKHQIKPAALRRIEDHRAAGHHLLLVTASLDFYVQRLGRTLGFDHVLSTKAAWTDHNTLSGDMDGPNLKGNEKVNAVQKWLSENYSFKINNAEEVENLIVYSDHHSDLPLMLFAGTAIAVDPTPELAHAAGTYNFSIERWNAV